jgi:hypothetical protein
MKPTVAVGFEVGEGRGAVAGKGTSRIGRPEEATASG